MAKVWFVRRVGGAWVAPGGVAAYEMPLSQLVFKLDLGGQRRLGDDAAPDLGEGPPPAEIASLKKVFVQVGEADVGSSLYPGFRTGWYDSPYSPAEVARRLGPPRWSAAAA